MPNWDEVNRIALAMPETAERPAQLERISLPDLEELIAEAWLSRAPKRLARSYLEE